MLEFITKNQLRKLENDLETSGIDADFIVDGFTLNKLLKEIKVRRSKTKKNNKLMAAMRRKLERVNAGDRYR